MIINYIILFSAISFLLSLAFVPVVIKLAHLRGWIVAPRKDRWHSKPTALMGGIAIFVTFLSLVIASSIYFTYNWMIVFSFFLMFCTGLIDDLYELKPIYKLLSQVVSTSILIFQGYVFASSQLGLLGIPITFLFVIGITNAINLLDNMDGLSAGVSSIVAVVTGILAYQSNNFTISMISFLIAGSTLGFLYYNFKPAKIFMGDCGSLFLGFSLSYLSISIQQTIGTSSVYIILILPLAILALPILDTSLVTIKRLLSGRKVYMGGRDHTSHRLVALGLSERKAVLILYGITLLWGLSAVFLINSRNSNLYLPVVSILIILTSFFGLFLSRIKVYQESEEKLAYLRLRGQYLDKSGFLLRFLLMNKKIIFGVSFDIIAISASFYFSMIITNTLIHEASVLLGLMISIKVLFYFFFKSYRKSWSYISLPDINSYIISGLLSSLISYFLISKFISFELIDTSFFMTDFLLTLFAVVFLRMIFKYFRETILRFRTFEKRVLIFGAGELGNLLCKYLHSSTNMSLKPVGFIDDDRSLNEVIFNGIPVLGNIDSVKENCSQHHIDEVIIAVGQISDEKVRKILSLLDGSNVSVSRFNPDLIKLK